MTMFDKSKYILLNQLLLKICKVLPSSQILITLRVHYRNIFVILEKLHLTNIIMSGMTEIPILKRLNNT